MLFCTKTEPYTRIMMYRHPLARVAEAQIAGILDTLDPETAMDLLQNVQERQRTRSIHHISIFRCIRCATDGDDTLNDVSTHIYGMSFDAIMDFDDDPLRHHPMCAMVLAYIPDVGYMTPFSLGAGMTYTVKYIPLNGEEHVYIHYGELREVPELTPYDVHRFIEVAGIEQSDPAWDRLWDLVRECLV
jgi:hypothetical protein